ncbi:sensor histidine kinase [Ferruginibacter sp.]
MRTFSLLLLLFTGQFVSAQLFNNISSFTTQDGLSNNTVTCLQKDSAGFLWIGTHEGLNRYDGTQFINVLSNEKNNLPSNNITRICFINKNLAVVGTDAGLCLLNTATLTGTRIELPVVQKFAITGYFIPDILYQKKTGELWVTTWHGIFVLNSAGKIIRKIMSDEARLPDGFFGKFLFRDMHDDVYFYSQQSKGFFYPDFAAQTIIPVEKKWPGFTFNELLKNNYSLMDADMLDHEATFIFSKKTGPSDEDYVCYYNTTTGRSFSNKLAIDFLADKRIAKAFPLSDSIFILNSYFGEPLLYNSNNNSVKKAADHPLWFTSWPDGLGAFLLKDELNIWIGTSKDLLQSSLRTNLFKTDATLTNALKDKKSLVSYNYATYRNNKLFLACMGAGLFAFDTVHHTVESYLDNPPAAFTRKLISNGIFDAGRSIWLFSVYGPAQVDPGTKKISNIEGINKESNFDNAASYPFKDSKGNIWTTLPSGVSRYNIATGSFTNFKSKYEGGIFPLLRAGPKAEDTKGNIWMTRQDSLIKYDAATQSFSNVTLIKRDGKPLRPINGIASDGADVLYINAGGYFALYTISTGKVETFTKQTGIISTVINELVSDKQGNAWLATEGGLVFYNKERKKFSSFTKADGLPDDNIVSINFADDAGKILFLGFSKSYCLFEPQNFLQKKMLPQNVITGVEVDGVSFSPGIQQTFAYEQNNISFSYTGINYNQGQQNNYAVMLEGFDQDWKYPGTERKVNYIHLPPGKYVFKIKSANHQGEWNEQPATFTFEIKPPFWQRWWFVLLIALIVLFSIFYLIRRREILLQKENKIKLQMSELRMQALRAQMNPHFIFNSLNSIQNYILSNNTIDAAGYLSKFAKLMRRILDQSKHNFLPLGEAIETLKLYVEIEAFRFNNEFSYAFDIEDDDDLLNTNIPPMLLQPFVENAILHGLMPKQGDKKLLISCKLIGKTVQIIIDDNGIGRTQLNAKAGHTSQGEKLTAGMLESLQHLQNTKASIEIIDKKENDSPTGTTVKLLLPLN